ncbi:MAG: hypothetical protein AVDCRST_MAG04-2535 [uncultured Acetobacteraceae bacterium]|uniref:Uncharacterized protein n=1 Tax=uncultured Acetobacteraceae bacterium TaxID=169975 RepID=A0A6J4IRB1_9PROT|nr:MAG: hypothetical protein AVDCRST_MAG04-2535 [uncultured Acetobacteraceae bacterium]
MARKGAEHPHVARRLLESHDRRRGRHRTDRLGAAGQQAGRSGRLGGDRHVKMAAEVRRSAAANAGHQSRDEKRPNFLHA